jgi:hypothetical protein
MRLVQWFGFAVSLVAISALAQSSGTVPRPSADKYASRASTNDASIGAARISDKLVHKFISPEVEDCCVVVEVALYPAKGGKIEVAVSDFSLHVVGEDSAVKASTAAAIAKQLPYVVQLASTGGGSGAMVGPHPQVDSRTGGVSHDPITGMPRRDGTYTPNGVDGGVGIGGSQGSQSGSVPQKREIELKMAEKGIPEGITSTPVAGYLYFSLEKKKNARYQLEYTLNGSKVFLQL